MQSDVAVLLKPISLQDVIGESTGHHDKQAQVALIEDEPKHKKQSERDFSAFYDCV